MLFLSSPLIHPFKSSCFLTYRPCNGTSVVDTLAVAVSTTCPPSGGTLVIGFVIAAVKLNSAVEFPVAVGIAT